MRPRSKSMPDLRADSLSSHHTLHSNNNKHEHAQFSTQLILPAEVCNTDKVMISNDMMPKYVPPRDVRKKRAPWLRRQLRNLRTQISSQFRYPLQSDNFVRDIIIEVPVGNNFNCRRAKALFDTGCSKNLMSLTMASTVGAENLARIGKPIMDTLGKDKFISLGCIERRWASCNESLDPKYYDAKWEVSDKHEPYDVIIGRDMMIENKFIKISSKLG